MKITCTIILLLLVNSLFAQNKTMYNEYYNYFNPEQSSFSWKKNTINTQNEIEFIGNMLFMAYKELISSQDSHSCTFTPTCSEYALQTIKTNGLFLGVLDTFDRLTRCNGLSPEKYEHNHELKRLSDPVIPKKN